VRIAVDAIPLLSPFTGVGKYTYSVARALRAIDLENEYHYYYGYFSRTLRSRSEGARGPYRIKEAVKRVPLLREAVRSCRGAASTLLGGKFDLYFEPNFIPIGIRSSRVVVTVPDFSFALYPQWHPRDRVEHFRRNFWKNIWRAGRIIFISDFIRESALEIHSFPPEILRTIHLGCDTDVFRVYSESDLAGTAERLGLPERFILFVGSIEPRKNLVRLVRAYKLLDPKVRREYRLVLAGFRGWENREIMDELARVREDVLYLGYIPEEDLGRLFNLASLFVFPSLYEGFGLPPIEAMACGCPVVASRAASIPEVCGDAAYYVDPTDEEEILQGILRVLTDSALRERLVRRGLSRAAEFTWERAAREHLQVFNELV